MALLSVQRQHFSETDLKNDIHIQPNHVLVSLSGNNFKGLFLFLGTLTLEEAISILFKSPKQSLGHQMEKPMGSGSEASSQQLQLFSDM
jgi:hypothetical protein